MSDHDDNLPAPPPPTAPARVGERRLRIGGKLRAALDLMVFGDENGNTLPWNDAARAANMNVRAMRRSLEKNHIRQHLRAQRQVFLAAAGAKNISRLVELRDQNENRGAAVKAVAVLEQMGEQRQGDTASRVITPGIVIVINREREVAVDDTLIEINPLSDMGGIVGSAPGWRES